MIHVLIATDLPDPLGRRGAIEGALRGCLDGFPGSWLVHVRSAHVPSWWTITIRRVEDDFKRTLVLDPAKQTPGHVAATLAALLEEIS